jgi:hypothetical protein
LSGWKSPPIRKTGRGSCGCPVRLARDELAPTAAAVGTRWLTVLSGVTGPDLRPEPLVWSPLEYACHVRDVFDIADYRVHLMLEEHNPLFANWDQDAAAVEERYGSQNPSSVASQIVERASVFSATLESVTDDQWAREGRRSDGARFTVESFARYLLHDPVHHLTDVTQKRWVDSS